MQDTAVLQCQAQAIHVIRCLHATDPAKQMRNIGFRRMQGPAGKKPGGFLRPGATRLVMRLELSATEVDVLAAGTRLLLTRSGRQVLNRSVLSFLATARMPGNLVLRRGCEIRLGRQADAHENKI
ncbi:hypothetical protein [Rhizobium sp. 007]|uniref:hypothetical protein n=1 Tax=Rhizobium sp. 007 TaxID=2785056 RepID=UPI001FF00CEB|nr:hypothetical protein [Rhizobium sp. 007]